MVWDEFCITFQLRMVGFCGWKRYISRPDTNFSMLLSMGDAWDTSELPTVYLCFGYIFYSQNIMPNPMQSVDNNSKIHSLSLKILMLIVFLSCSCVSFLSKPHENHRKGCDWWESKSGMPSFLNGHSCFYISLCSLLHPLTLLKISDWWLTIITYWSYLVTVIDSHVTLYLESLIVFF